MTAMRVVAGLVGSVVMVPEMLQQSVVVEEDKAATGGHTIRITGKDAKRYPGEIRMAFDEDGRTPTEVTFAVDGVRGTVRFRGWQTNAIATEAMFEPPEGQTSQEVEQTDVHRVFAAALNFGVERVGRGGGSAVDLRATKLLAIARDPAGHGLLCRCQGKTI